MGGTEPALQYRAGGAGRGQARGHGQQGTPGRARGDGFRPGAGVRTRGRLRGERRRRNPDRPGPGIRAGGQPGSEHRGHRQRHLQLHPDPDDPRGLALRRGPAPGPGSSVTPRPTRPWTSTAPTPPTSWRSWRNWPSRPASGSTTFTARASTGCTWPTSSTPASSGYAIKLLALAKLSKDGLELRVAPTLVKHGTPLAEVRGPYNAIRVVGDAVGDTLFYGRGAGAMPTASAVVGDLIDVITGRAALPTRVLNLWSESAPAVALDPLQPGQEPLLPPLHDRRPARSARQVGPNPGRKGN